MSMEIFSVKNFQVVANHHPGDIVDMRVIVNAGSANEDKDSYGVAHFLEHMMFKGTKRHNYQQINRIAGKLGDINAHTNQFLTTYLIQTLREDVKKALELLLELVFEPSFPEDEFEKEKGTISEECQMYLDDPYSFFHQNAIEHLQGERYGHPIIGTLGSICEMDLNKIYRFVKSNYHPHNMIICFSGPLRRDEIESLLQNILPDVHDGVLNLWEDVELRLDNYHFHHNSKQAIFSLVAEGIPARGECESGYLPDIFCNALGGGMHSLLFDGLREQLGLCYNVWASHSSWLHGGMFSIGSMLDANNIDVAVAEIQKILKRVRQDGFDAELLEIAKINHLFRFAKFRLTPMGVSSLVEEYFQLGGFNLSEHIDFNRRSKVVNALTNNDMIEFARATLPEDENLTFITMTQDSHRPKKSIGTKRPIQHNNVDSVPDWML